MSRTASPTPLPRALPPLTLPPLHPGQQEVRDSDARFKVVCCGRQWGKTALGAALCVEEAYKGGRVQWVAPSFPIGELGWQFVEHLCRQIPGASFNGRPVWRVTLPGGGTIQLRSADNPDSLRGATLDGVVFDEAALAKPEAWPFLRPTLSVREGWAVFISTPKGYNWFHDLYEQAATLPGWTRWRFPSLANPYLSADDVAEAKLTMSSHFFGQEYEAEFISYGLGVFHSEWLQRFHVRLEDDEQVYMLGAEAVPRSSCRIFHTVDLAWSVAETADFTVIATWAVTPKSHLLLIDCVRGRMEGPDIVPRMRAAVDKHGGHLIVERATRQMSIIQEAVRVGLPIREVRAEKDKVSRAQAAAARMEQGTVWFPQASWWPELEDELMAFPSGRHDDFVDAFGYAVRELRNQSAYSEHDMVIV